MTYSIDLRKRVLNYLKSGGSKSEASKIFGVCSKTIWNWAKRESLGILEPKQREAFPRKINHESLLQYIQDHPEAHLKQIGDQFGVTPPAIFYACKKLKISLKKRRSLAKSKTRKKRRTPVSVTVQP